MFDEEPKLPAGNYSIEVGNDVYMGYGVTVIIGPCKIGDGAVIASGAVVTSNIPPYTIVGGIPAKTIKKRFSDADIAFLEDLQWWNRPEGWIGNHAGYFVSIEQLKAAMSKEQ